MSRAAVLRAQPRLWLEHGVRSTVLQLALLLLVQHAVFTMLFRAAPLAQHEYQTDMLFPHHARGGALAFVAPFALVVFVATSFTKLRERVPGSRAFGVLVVVLATSLALGGLSFVSPLKFSQMFEPALVADLLRRDVVTLSVVASLVLVGARWRTTSWAAIDPRRRGRALTMVCAALLTWSFAMMETNLFYGRDYDVDRLLLVALLVALWAHPVALGPFLVMLLTLAGQAHRPLPEGTWMWPDKVLPLGVLCVVQGYVIVLAVMRDRVRPPLLPLAVLCLIGASYAHAAANKALLGPSLGTWAFENDLSNLFVSSHVHGRWLGDWSEQNVLAVAAVLHSLRLPLAAGGFAIEASAALMAMGWRTMRVIVVALLSLHVGIYLISGIFFWKWMIVDVAFVAYVALLRRDAKAIEDASARARADLFRPLHRWLSVVAIALAPLYFVESKFAWFDTRLTNRFEIVGIGESGARYPIDARFFAPYDIVMQQSRHGYAVSFPMLVGTYGTTNEWSRAQELQHATPEDVAELRDREEASGPLETSEVFFVFVRTSLDEAQRRGRRGSFRTVLAPPFHFRTTLAPDHFDFQERLVAAEVRYIETLHSDAGLLRTRDVEVRRLELAPAP